uniref:Peptidase A1 domain-containing protein n=1 Tax=Panagrolaimus superbus TaxID=310955 RepID=A0A914YD27_9BILA
MKLLILLALFGLTTAAVYQHQLIRVESRKSRMIKEGTWEAYKLTKSGTQSLNDFDDAEYLANITVGTPPQSFLIQLDTGSSDFWIPDSSCTDGFACRHAFDANESSTYVQNGKSWIIRYGDGSYSEGIVGEDTVRFGSPDDEALVVPNSAIGQATKVYSGIGPDAADGILGLAFPSIDEEKSDPILFNAFKQGLLDKPIFTVYLQERGPKKNVPGGFITYGGLDTEHCSPDVDYVDLTSATYYQFKMDSVSLGTTKFSDGWQVISDTGTTMIYAPEEISRQLTIAAGAKADGSIDCNASFDDLKLTIGGKEYSVPAKQLILDEGGDNGCQFGIRPSGDSDWILGDAWMRSYCNVFGFKDQNIGFAKIIA